MHDDVPLAYQVCVLCLTEPTVCLVSTLAHCILGIFIVREATVMFGAVDACLFYLMQVPYSTHYPPMMYYPPITFFGQKLCGRVFIMAYGSTPYVGMTPEKNGGHIQSAQMTRSKCPR